MKVTKIEQVKVGDTLKVLNCPKTWSSHLADLYPLQKKFPCEIKIKDLKDRINFVAISDYEGCGWDLTSIIKAGCELIKENQDKKDMKVVKSKTLTINGQERDVTIVVLLQDGQLYGGYSVRVPEDKQNDILAEKIATGRALKESTNLLDMEVGQGMYRKFILYAVADYLLGKIQKGVINIKGVKK